MAAPGRLFVPRLEISTGDVATVNDTTSQLFVPGQLGQWSWIYPTSSYFSTFNLSNRPIAVQYVQMSATNAVTPAIGAAAFVKDYDDFIVTPDASDSLSTANNIYNCVGVFLGTSLAAGNYGFIAIGGIVPILLKGSPTVAADATGSLVAVPEASTDSTFDCIGATQLNATTGTPSETTAADKLRHIVAKVLSAKNTPTGIGTDVVKGLLFPYGGVGGC